MRRRILAEWVLASTYVVMMGVMLLMARPVGAAEDRAPVRPQGPCDIYATAGDPCVAAHSTTRALYASYNGSLYQVVRQSDGKSLNIGVVQPAALPAPDAGGYADAAAQDAFCANTVCWITKIYDQSNQHNDLTQAPRGGFSGPALGGFNNVPVADMAPVTMMGHKVYGIFIEPGMGLRNDDPKGTAVDDQAEGQYWVINGLHFNSGCCFDYGNAEIDSRDDDNGTMEATYYGDAPYWYHGTLPGPWIMTDQENNLVGCVNSDGSNHCTDLPKIDWRFVTAMAKGEPHHWTSMGGDAQRGPLQVMFSGQRVNATYDPMRKQGAILLGNGGDNSNGSQGTFYEGAMTAAGTFPTDATDQKVQANIVAAGYGVLPVSVAATSGTTNPTGMQTFEPQTSEESTVTFTNTTGAAVADVTLSLEAPDGWSATVAGSSEKKKSFSGSIAPGTSVSATFKVTSGALNWNGDLTGKASWTNQASGKRQTEAIAEKVRNAQPVKINEFRISSGPPTNATDSFIELYNAGEEPVDISRWTLTVHPTQQAIFSTIRVPSDTKLKAHGFYLLGLANSGLAAAAHAGSGTVYVRETTGMEAGDTIHIGSGSREESRKIVSVGTAASNHTTLWQPLPDGPVITIPEGATNVPVMSTDGFAVGQKIALGYGATYPTVPAGMEKYEVATVTAVGKPGTQAYLATDAAAGTTSINVTSVSDISVGDMIRLDIDSVGHGIETVKVSHVGTEAKRTNLAADAPAGATQIKVRSARGFAAGNKIILGTPVNQQTVTITAIRSEDTHNAMIEFTPALSNAHIRDEGIVEPGTGIELTAPLKFNHAANLPFSDRGTGISFEPATAFVHMSNEPIQALGTGITLESPLTRDHAINAVVRDAGDTRAGYQGAAEPSQWFGGPELVTHSPLFGHVITVREGSMILRDASGLVVDSLNYGGLVDPWAAEGYQAASGMGKSGCFVTTPGLQSRFGFGPTGSATNTSAGRFPDGLDTDSNCDDFVTSPATTLAAASDAGAANIKVASVEGFGPGQTIRIDAGSNLETAVIETVGTAGATTVTSSVGAGSTVVHLGSTMGFSDGQSIRIGSGKEAEAAKVAFVTPWDNTITVAAPLAHAHAAGAQVSGTGITLASPLSRAHAGDAAVTGNTSTPGSANRYFRERH